MLEEGPEIAHCTDRAGVLPHAPLGQRYQKLSAEALQMSRTQPKVSLLNGLTNRQTNGTKSLDQTFSEGMGSKINTYPRLILFNFWWHLNEYNIDFIDNNFLNNLDFSIENQR